MSLWINSKDMENGAQACAVSSGALSTKFVYGENVNLMIATRTADYHSRPHIHDSEQLNYVLDGQIWVFVEDKGNLYKEGDFFRIPKNLLHWSWVKSDRPCTLIEAHSPVLDPSMRKGTVGLFSDNEKPVINSVPSFSVEKDVQEVESRYIK